MSRQRGFTLIEILIALAIFAILATITSSAMYYAFNTRTRVIKQADGLNDLQLAISRIERDTSQALPREVRGNKMHIFPAFMGESHGLEFTRGGVINPNAEEKRSHLQRIALFCRNDQLLRKSWDSLDTPNRNHYQETVLVSGLKNCQFAYLNHALQVLSQWRAHAVQLNQKEEPLPKAIQLNLAFKDWGKMSFLFIIPGALYAQT